MAICILVSQLSGVFPGAAQIWDLIHLGHAMNKWRTQKNNMGKKQLIKSAFYCIWAYKFIIQLSQKLIRCQMEAKISSFEPKYVTDFQMLLSTPSQAYLG